MAKYLARGDTKRARSEPSSTCLCRSAWIYNLREVPEDPISNCQFRKFMSVGSLIGQSDVSLSFSYDCQTDEQVATELPARPWWLRTMALSSIAGNVTVQQAWDRLWSSGEPTGSDRPAGETNNRQIRYCVPVCGEWCTPSSDPGRSNEVHDCCASGISRLPNVADGLVVSEQQNLSLLQSSQNPGAQSQDTA